VAPTINANDLAAKYGYAASFFNADPELKKLLAAAVKAQWSPEEFSARFMNSGWYKNHSSSLKDLLALKAKEPAEYNKRMSDSLANMQTEAGKLGITVDPARLKSMATNAVLYAWDQGQIDRAFAAEMKYNPNGQPGGDVGSMQSQIRQNAADYGITLGDQDIFSMAQKIVGGSLDQEGALEHIKQLAAGRYPGLQDEIKKGLSVREAASTYVQSQARILEVDPNQIDLATDPNLQKALQARGPDGKPIPGGVPLWQYEQQLKQDPKWLQTNNARQDMNGVANKVLKDFGLVS